MPDEVWRDPRRQPGLSVLIGDLQRRCEQLERQMAGMRRAAGGGSSIDHGGLGGLDDDDHPQYVHAAGDTMTGNLAIDKATPVLRLQALTGGGMPIIQLYAQAGQHRMIDSYTGTSRRWSLRYGDNTAESGNDAGSDISLHAFKDAGGSTQALGISRATRLVTVAGDPTAALGIATKQYVDALHGGVRAWQVRRGATDSASGNAAVGFAVTTGSLPAGATVGIHLLAVCRSTTGSSAVIWMRPKLTNLTIVSGVNPDIPLFVGTTGGAGNLQTTLIATVTATGTAVATFNLDSASWEISAESRIAVWRIT